MAKSQNNIRINEFIETVMKVARGDYSAQVGVSGNNDELDSLAVGINMMIDEIRNSISEHKRSEEEILKSKQRLENVTYGIRDGVLLLSKDLKIIWANNAFLEQGGRRLKEVIGKYCYEVTHYRKSPCQPPHDICPINDVLASGEPKTEIHTHFDKQGNKFFAEVSAYPIKDEKGQVIQFVHVSRNVTDRIQAEEQIKQAANEWAKTFDSMADGISVHGTDYAITKVNQALCDMLGKKKEELVGKKCYEIFHGKDMPIKDCPMEKAKQTGHKEYVEIFEPGLKAWLAISTSPIKDENGKVVSVVHAIRDISERKQRQERMRKVLLESQAANERLRDIDMSKDELLSIVTHDLKSPLVPVEGYADMLRKGLAGPISDRQKVYAERIKEQSIKMRAMIDQLLDYTHVEFGKIKLNPEVFQINNLVVEAVEEIMPEADKKKMKIDLDLSKDELAINADKRMIGRVISNLISNAIKYTPEGGRMIISLRRANGNVHFSVADNGIGISKDDLPKVFDKFFMVEQKKVRERGSLGLGLHIAKDFIEAHGGKIWAESEGEGKGSKFNFTLAAA
ncbi:MAG: PAS domain-containing protein [Candidatus Margulisiibacteriota bacterium]